LLGAQGSTVNGGDTVFIAVVGQPVKLAASGEYKMRLRGHEIVTGGTVVGIDDRGSPVIIYVEFPGIRRPDGKKRFGFTVEDLQ
jgi:hypothetical protein